MRSLDHDGRQSIGRACAAARHGEAPFGRGVAELAGESTNAASKSNTPVSTDSSGSTAASTDSDATAIVSDATAIVSDATAIALAIAHTESVAGARGTGTNDAAATTATREEADGDDA